MNITTYNPYDGTKLTDYTVISDKEVQNQLEKSHQAFLKWSQLSIEQRKHFINSLIRQLMDFQAQAAELMALEMGKPVKFGNIEIEKCISLCQYYLKQADVFLTPKHIKTEFYDSYVMYQPIGVIFSIMPWNFPFWQVFRAIIPNLILGNTIVLKHASNVTGCGQLIEKIFHQAGFPDDVFKHLLITVSQVDRVIAHPKVRGVTLTGSEEVGRKVAAEAGRHLKKVVLELGGNDPMIILKDADLEQAAKAIIQSRMRNTGQVCVAAKRIIVDATIEPQLLEYLFNEIKIFKMGNPIDLNCNYGPMAREDLRTQLHQQIQTLIQQGATLLYGGEIPSIPGCFYPPTIIKNVSKESLAFKEEIFGPVVCITTFDSEEEAMTLANSTMYGLGASIFTNQLERAEKMADAIEAGICFVNLPVTSDIRFPFGGIKNSGYGRELSVEGMLEFSNIKTVIINELK
jgi:succinate-semialdehyde dehydrogenase / glutarate-semialdehyde dehydrogenase